MNILAITCSESVGSVSFHGDDTKTISWSSPNTHSEKVTEAVYECLNGDLSNVDLIAVDVGPGSFTGIRVALGTSRTLAYSQNLPMYLCSSIKLLANQIKLSSGFVYVAQNAFTEKFFFGKYRIQKFNSDNGEVDLEEVISPCVITRLKLGSYLSVSDGVLVSSSDFILENHKNFKGHKLYPSSEMLIKLAFKGRKGFVSWDKAEPLYLRPSSAQEKLEHSKCPIT